MQPFRLLDCLGLLVTPPCVARFGGALLSIEEAESNVPADGGMEAVVSRIVEGDGILMLSMPLRVMTIRTWAIWRLPSTGGDRSK
jgi:hypothetical protein